MKVPSTVFMFVPQENTVFCKHNAKVVKKSYIAKEMLKKNKSEGKFSDISNAKTLRHRVFSRFLNTEDVEETKTLMFQLMSQLTS